MGGRAECIQARHLLGGLWNLLEAYIAWPRHPPDWCVPKITCVQDILADIHYSWDLARDFDRGGFSGSCTRNRVTSAYTSQWSGLHRDDDRSSDTFTGHRGTRA